VGCDNESMNDDDDNKTTEHSIGPSIYGESIHLIISYSHDHQMRLLLLLLWQLLLRRIATLLGSAELVVELLVGITVDLLVVLVAQAGAVGGGVNTLVQLAISRLLNLLFLSALADGVLDLAHESRHDWYT